jgi:hypothetical protein
MEESEACMAWGQWLRLLKVGLGVKWWDILYSHDRVDMASLVMQTLGHDEEPWCTRVRERATTGSCEKRLWNLRVRTLG